MRAILFEICNSSNHDAAQESVRGEFTMEVTSETGGWSLMRALQGDEEDAEAPGCAQAKEIEMTFELPRGEYALRHPGRLQEFRLVE